MSCLFWGFLGHTLLLTHGKNSCWCHTGTFVLSVFWHTVCAGQNMWLATLSLFVWILHRCLCWPFCIVCLGTASDCLEGKEQLSSIPTRGETIWGFFLINPYRNSECFSLFFGKAVGQGGELFAHRCANRMLCAENLSLRSAKQQLKTET